MIGQNLMEDIMENALLKSSLGYGVESQPHFSVKQNDGQGEPAF